MGKPRDLVWRQYDQDGPRAVCRHCGKRFTAIVQRMKAHLRNQCPSCPPDVKELYASFAVPPRARRPPMPPLKGFVLVPVDTLRVWMGVGRAPIDWTGE